MQDRGRREQGAVLSEQNRNEMVAAGGKRAPGKKVAGKAETRMREGTTKDFVGRLSCPVLLSPGGTMVGIQPLLGINTTTFGAGWLEHF